MALHRKYVKQFYGFSLAPGINFLPCLNKVLLLFDFSAKQPVLLHNSHKWKMLIVGLRLLATCQESPSDGEQVFEKNKIKKIYHTWELALSCFLM